MNGGTTGHWLKLRLEGGGTTVNRSAIGAQVRIKLANTTLTRQVEAGTGEGNPNDLVLHFGLGAHSSPVDLEIRWPGGTVQRLTNVGGDRLPVVRRQPGRRIASERRVAIMPSPWPSRRGSVSAGIPSRGVNLAWMRY